jgi:tetratricopeptide (TPR) repeat protein
MLMDIHVCPRCSQRIETERRRDSITICSSCGFVVSSAEKRQSVHSHQSFIFVGVALLIGFVAALAQISAWDYHWLEVIPLQVKELAGMSNKNDMERMAEICIERKRWSCAEEQYFHLSKKDPSQLLKLGKLQMSRLRYKDAAETFRRFFSGGGKDLDASFQYARALSQVGQLDEASKYYRFILRSRLDPIMRAAAQDGLDSIQRKKMTTTRGIASVSPQH